MIPILKSLFISEIQPKFKEHESADGIKGLHKIVGYVPASCATRDLFATRRDILV